MERIILIGAGGHAKTVVDTIKKQNLFEIAGFIDYGEKGREVYRGYKLIGNDGDLKDLYLSGIQYAFVCIGFMGRSTIREILYEKLTQIGFTLPLIIDETAVVAEDVKIGEGTYVGRNAVLNVAASVGKMCIINTATVVEHEADVGDFSHIAVGAVMCGGAKTGRGTLIGANSTIIQNIEVGEGSIIVAGSVVVDNIPPLCVAAGVPSRVIKDISEI